MQQLLILSAMRPERMSQCMESFVYTVLEPTLKQRRISSVADVTHVVKNLKPTEVPVILFREDPDLAVTRLQQYTSRMEVSWMYEIIILFTPCIPAKGTVISIGFCSGSPFLLTD